MEKGNEISEEANSPYNIQFCKKSNCWNSCKCPGYYRIDNQFPLYPDYMCGDIIRFAGTLHWYDTNYKKERMNWKKNDPAWATNKYIGDWIIEHWEMTE